jgi:hypothetical protein
MEVSGQLHAPAALTLGKEPPVSIGQEAAWAPGPVWTTWRKFLTLPGQELLPLGTPTCSQSLYRLRYPGSTQFPIGKAIPVTGREGP